MECIREHLSFQNVIFHHHHRRHFSHIEPLPQKSEIVVPTQDTALYPDCFPDFHIPKQGPTSFGLGTAHHPVYMACIYLYENPYAIVDRYWNWIDFMEYGTQGETDYYTKQHQRNRCHEVFGFISESNSQSGNGLIWRCINMNLPLNRSCGWTVLGA